MRASKVLAVNKVVVTDTEKLTVRDAGNGMRKYGRYNIIVFGAITCLFVLLCWLALWMDPLDKDLTRVGGFLENDFGWNNPQEIFEKPLFILASTIDDYNFPFQVVVCGDSFSMNKSSGWQNYFVAQTRKSVFTIVSNRGFLLADILKNTTFKETPPDVLIYEVAERNLLQRIHQDTVTQRSTKGTAQESVGTPPIIDQFATKLISRPNGGIQSFNMDSAADYVRKSILKFIFGDWATDARLARLKTSKLFSNRRSNELLFFDAELKTGELSDKQRFKIIEQLKIIRKKVESNGKTKFVLLIAPNKLTTYWDFLDSFNGKEPVIIKEIQKTFPEATLPTDQLFQNMVAKGIIDVYLPNDTHWGSTGHEAAATALVNFLSH